MTQQPHAVPSEAHAPGDAVRVVLDVAEAEDGERLDRLMAARMAEISRSFAQTLIKAGDVYINGEVAKPATRVRSGDRVEVLSHEVRTLRVTRFATPEAFRDYFCAHYGPTIAVRRSLGDDRERLAALDEALVALARDAAIDVGGTLEWEHLVTLARRR